jgi:hypothetical protein
MDVSFIGCGRALGFTARVKVNHIRLQLGQAELAR